MLGIKSFNFLRRNPVISVRTSEHVTSASANVSEQNIRKWFDDIHQYLSDENLSIILNDPSRVFNGDETGFSLCPKIKSVLGPKGAKDVYEVAKVNEKENLTVMFTFNAAGIMCHPMVICSYKRIPQHIIDSVTPNWGVGRSDTGWMKAEVFYEYIANVFHPFLIENSIQFLVILFVDGHTSHLTYQLSNLCSQLNIILIALYPNATRILQPADVAAFKPLKSGWKKGLFEWRNQNPNCAVTKKDFAPILDQVIKNTVKSEVLINGFRACGLYPWNVNQIDFKKCLGKNKGPELNDTDNSDITKSTNTAHATRLSFNDFSDIVGVETLEKFNNIHDEVETQKYSEEFFTLYRLFEKLKKDNSDESTIRLSPINSTAQPYDINSTNQISPCNFKAQSPDCIVINNQNELLKQQTYITTSSNILEKPVSTPTNFVNVKKLNITPIESCLVWPVTPERKNNRMTERVPYVITSKNWKYLYEQKEHTKRTIEEDKETRKRLREENKILKANQPTKLTKQKVVKNLFPVLNKNKKPTTVTSQTISYKNFEGTNNADIDLEEPFNINVFNSVIESGCCISCDTEIKVTDLGV